MSVNTIELQPDAEAVLAPTIELQPERKGISTSAESLPCWGQREPEPMA